MGEAKQEEGSSSGLTTRGLWSPPAGSQLLVLSCIHQLNQVGTMLRSVAQMEVMSAVPTGTTYGVCDGKGPLQSLFALPAQTLFMLFEETPFIMARMAQIPTPHGMGR